MKTNGNHAGVDTEEDEDVKAGPQMPPNEEPEGPDDEEGRFFGGGITRDTADVLDFMEEQDPDELVSLLFHSIRVMQEFTNTSQKPEKIDIAWLRRLALVCLPPTTPAYFILWLYLWSIGQELEWRSHTIDSCQEISYDSNAER